MNLVDQVEAKEMKKEVADVHIGDTVKVHMRIVEGEKERIQVIQDARWGSKKDSDSKKNFIWHWCRAYFSNSFSQS